MTENRPIFFWGTEVIHAMYNGRCKIEITGYYRFSRHVKIFDKFIDVFYHRRLQFKKEGNVPMAMVMKLCMNSLSGKLG